MIRSASTASKILSLRLLRAAATTTVTPNHRHVRSFATLLERAQRQQLLSARREAHNQEQQQQQTAACTSHGSNNKTDDQQEGHINDPEAMAIFDEMDINGDGVISREEFRIALQKMRDLDLTRMKRALLTNDIAFNHRASVLGRRVIVNDDQFNAWQFIKSLPDYRYVQEPRHSQGPLSFALPPKKAEAPEYTLVLDLDETLLHCDVDIPNLDHRPDHTFAVKFQGKRFTVHAWMRPGLQAFLDKICGKFEVVIFTASQAAYANAILDIIDPGR